MRGKTGGWTRVLRVLCAFALTITLVASGFVMQRAASDKATVSLSYMLPDGSIPVLCLTDTHENAPGEQYFHAGFCEACRIDHAVLLPLPCDTPGPRLIIEIACAMATSAQECAPQPPYRAATAPRAPPNPRFARLNQLSP